MLTVKVRRRKGPPTPYAWEIYRSNDPRWIKRSMHGYSTGKRRRLLASEPCSVFSNSKELTETNDNGRDAGHPRDPYQLAKTVFGTATARSKMGRPGRRKQGKADRQPYRQSWADSDADNSAVPIVERLCRA
jgi:hypothetical protein